jgi:hypothetical protein
MDETTTQEEKKTTGIGVVTASEADANEAAASNTKSYADSIAEQYENYAKQQQNSIDYSTNKNINSAVRDYEDAVSDYRTNTQDLTTSMYQNMDNQALVSRANGQYGGMATASVGAVQSEYQAQRQALARQQQQLATDTLREVEDLRTQGEFDKADALLAANQQKFQALYEDAVRVDENQYSNNQWQTTLDREDAEIQRQQEQSDKQYLQQLGQAFLSAGAMPSTAMLEAMGLDQGTAQLYINMILAGY